MPDQTQSSNQQVIIYALVAIAVLLAAIVGFMIYQRTTALPSPTASVSSTTAASSSTSAAAPSSAMTAPATNAPFDPKTATKLAAGVTPDAAIKAYSAAVMASDYKTAFGLLPLASKSSYGTSDGMATQLKPYGITGFKQSASTASGADTSIVLEEDTPAMNITYTWVFTKVGNTWYVKGRTMGGSL
ncbi:MAG: hypothetical protein P4L93_05740 [Coriobacteriia bacterium]|nr:hypothetical protein [Coriobacteriia bacterium]